MLRKVLRMMEKSLEGSRQRKRDEQPPTYEILRELQVTTEHFSEFQQMMKDGELERMTFNSYEHPSIYPSVASWRSDVRGDWRLADSRQGASLVGYG